MIIVLAGWHKWIIPIDGAGPGLAVGGRGRQNGGRKRKGSVVGRGEAGLQYAGYGTVRVVDR